MERFIQNHQFNAIKRHTETLQKTYNTIADRKVIDAVKYSAETHVKELFPVLMEEQKRLLEPLFERKSKIEYEEALRAVSDCVLPFPDVTEAGLKKLFPKVKKLKAPDLAAVDFAALTYLGWVDGGSSKLYIVYERAAKLVGVEARLTPTGSKGVCSLCSRHAEVGLVTAVSKAKSANNPDYYKAVGNYMCVDSTACNKQITDLSYLEKFIGEIVD